MAEYENRVRSMAADTAAVDVGLRAYILRVYNYMLMGLALTGAAAWFTASTPVFSNLFFQVSPRGYSLSALGRIVFLPPRVPVLFLRSRTQPLSLSPPHLTASTH